MIERKAPWPKSIEELSLYIRELISQAPTVIDDDAYQKVADDMALAAQAAFNLVAYLHGTTGFQASYAGLKFLMETRGIKGPMAILTADNYLYPQHGTPMSKAAEFYEDWKPWLKEEAQKLLDSRNSDNVADSVRNHWIKLASWSEVK